MRATQTLNGKLKKKMARKEAENAALRAELALERKRSAILVAGRIRRNSAKLTGRVTPVGGYTMALMRNSAHVGTLGLVKMLQLPVSRVTVERWERLLATNLLIQSRLFYQTLRSAAHADHTQALGAGLSWELHNIRGDATNSSCGQHSLKAFVGAIDSRIRDVYGECVNHSIYPDLQARPVHCCGHTVRGMYMKQLESCDVELWTTPGASEATHGIHVRWYLFSSAQGGDHVASHKLIEAYVRGQSGLWYNRAWCLDHVDH